MSNHGQRHTQDADVAGGGAPQEGDQRARQHNPPYQPYQQHDSAPYERPREHQLDQGQQDGRFSYHNMQYSSQQGYRIQGQGQGPGQAPSQGQPGGDSPPFNMLADMDGIILGKSGNDFDDPEQLANMIFDMSGSSDLPDTPVTLDGSSGNGSPPVFPPYEAGHSQGYGGEYHGNGDGQNQGQWAYGGGSGNSGGVVDGRGGGHGSGYHGGYNPSHPYRGNGAHETLSQRLGLDTTPAPPLSGLGSPSPSGRSGGRNSGGRGSSRNSGSQPPTQQRYNTRPRSTRNAVKAEEQATEQKPTTGRRGKTPANANGNCPLPTGLNIGLEDTYLRAGSGTDRKSVV